MNFYDSIIEGAQELPTNERGQLYAAVLEYLHYGREPDFPMRPAPKAIFVSMHPVFENQRAKQEAGRNGGKAKAEPKQKPSRGEADGQADADQTRSETQANSNSNSKEKETANAVSKERARFVPPSPEEVDAHIAEKGYEGFDGEGFCAFYASKGWKVGNQPMRSWKQACVTWHKRRQTERGRGGGYQADGFDDFRI